MFAAVILLYQATYSSVPTSDGYTWIAHIDSGDPEGILPAYHALPMYLLFRLKPLLARLGIPAQTLALIQTVNAVLAALGAVLLYSLIRVIGGGVLLGWLGGGLLAVSFGYWYFANGELHHFSLVILQLIFLLLVRARMRGRPCGYDFLIGLGLLNALAVLLHQENFLFGFAAVAILMVGRPWRPGLSETLTYAAAGSLWTAILAVVIGVYLRGLTTPDELLRWFLWPFYSAEQPQPYTLGGPVAIVLKPLKGQLTALVFGTQVVGDVVKEPALLRSATVEWLVALTVLVYGAVALLLVDLWRRRRLIGGRFIVVGAGCVVWLLCYKVLLHSWFWPTAPEYHVVTLPPLILLLLLGPIAARAGGSRASCWRDAAVAALLTLMAGVNLQAGILPWYQYGRMKEVLTAQLRTTFRPDDFFLSFESGIDSVFLEAGSHLAVKEVFMRASREEGFATVRRAIHERLVRGQRVFIYNFVPNPFTLLGMNQAVVRRGEASLRPQDFEVFMGELRRTYVLAPVLSYWEEAKAPLYLFDKQSEVMWELREHRRGAGVGSVEAPHGGTPSDFSGSSGVPPPPVPA